MVATDGHRLALISVPSETPRRQGRNRGRGARDPAAQDAARARRGCSSEGDGDIHYERGENHLFFHVGGRLLISRKIDGQFPAFERVIPKGNDKRVEFDRDRLTSAVKRVALLSNERSRAVKFADRQGQGRDRLEQPGVRRGARKSLTVDYAGAPVPICFNAQYVVDFLSVVETDTVSLEFKDEMSQAVMKPVGAEGYDYTYVIMPMRI